MVTETDRTFELENEQKFVGCMACPYFIDLAGAAAIISVPPLALELLALNGELPATFFCGMIWFCASDLVVYAVEHLFHMDPGYKAPYPEMN